MPINSPAHPFLFEEYDFLDYNGFKPDLRRQFASDRMPDMIPNLVLEYQDDDLVIGFVWDDHVGKPGRYEKRSALCLGSGEYGRLIVNGRHTEYHPSFHWYSQATYNIVVVNQIIPDYFTSREPCQICDLRADLF
jgi:hypothetical protein